MPQIVAYLRDSGGESQELSTDQQLAAIRAWCAKNDFTLTEIFTDQAAPGSSTVGRAAFQDMMHYFRLPGCPAHGLVIWSYTRFARDIDDAQFFRSDLRRRGFTIYSLNDQIPEGSMGRLFEAAIDWKNEQFLEDLSRDVKRGLRHRVLAFGAVPGTPPFGFTRQKIEMGDHRDGRARSGSRWVADITLIPMIQRAFELRAAGWSYRKIKKETGIPLALNSLATFFRNKLYKGVLDYGSEQISDYCAPLVDAETWRKAQAKPRPKPDAEHPRRIPSDYLLSGILRCARCGSAMNGHRVRSWRYYMCRYKKLGACDMPPIPQKTIEQGVLGELQREIVTPEYLEALRRDDLANLERKAAEIRAKKLTASRTAAALSRKIDHLTDEISLRGASPALRAKLDKLEADLILERDKIRDLEKQSAPSPLALASEAEIAAFAAAFAKFLATGSREEIKLVIRGLVKTVTVDRDGDEIRGLIEVYEPDLKKVEAPAKGASYVYNVCPQSGTLHRPVKAHPFAMPLKAGQ